MLQIMKKKNFLTEEQARILLLPIHMALDLLPRGLFTAHHAADLVAFLTAIDFIAKNNNSTELRQAVGRATAVLLHMQQRVEHGKAWNVTAEERETLLTHILICDEAMQRQTVSNIKNALRATIKLCNKEHLKGIQK